MRKTRVTGTPEIHQAPGPSTGRRSSLAATSVGRNLMRSRQVRGHGNACQFKTHACSVHRATDGPCAVASRISEERSHIPVQAASGEVLPAWHDLSSGSARRGRRSRCQSLWRPTIPSQVPARAIPMGGDLGTAMACSLDLMPTCQRRPSLVMTRSDVILARRGESWHVNRDLIAAGSRRLHETPSGCVQASEAGVGVRALRAGCRLAACAATCANRWRQRRYWHSRPGGGASGAGRQA